MIGKFNIDGIDAYERFGVFISDAGLVSLLQYPPLKKVRIAMIGRKTDGVKRFEFRTL